MKKGTKFRDTGIRKSAELNHIE